MSNAKLVKHVCICSCEIGHRIVAKHQPLEHRFMDEPSRDLLIRFSTRTRQLNPLMICLYTASKSTDQTGPVGLLAEWHSDNKNGFTVKHCIRI